jgi:molybdopterin/thiamine biosynthesis adenylyltransferase
MKRENLKLENLKQLSQEDRELYEWQMWIPQLGEEGQKRLKSSSVLVTRIGGVGGTAALYLAAAGVGRLVLAHAGNIKKSDLHRQVLMSYGKVGQPRVEVAAARLRDLNPHVEIETVGENVSEANVAKLVEGVDLVVDGAPRFEERLLLNREVVRQKKVMVECAMYEMEGSVTTIVPGKTACLACLYPSPPSEWKREFPVLGAVSGVIGCLGAVEAIKVLAGIGRSLAGRMVICDLGEMNFRTVEIKKRSDCAVCEGI